MSKVSPKLQSFIFELVNHFENCLISYVLNLKNDEQIEQKSFSVGHTTHLMPSAAFADAVKRLTNLANEFHLIKLGRKKKVITREFAADWIADIQRHSPNSQARRVLVHVGLDLCYSFENIFEESDEELVETYAINAAEMILKYFASPIHGKKANFDAPTILKGLLECSGFNNSDSKSKPQLCLDEQTIIECCCGKFFSVLFKMDQDREKSKFGKLLCSAAILYQENVHEHTNRPRTEAVRRLLATIELNSAINVNSALEKFHMKRPASQFQFKINAENVWTRDNREGPLIEEILVKLAATHTEAKVEGMKAKIMEDIEKITKIYFLNPIEDLKDCLSTIENRLESDMEGSDEDEEKEDKKGAKTVNTISRNKINKLHQKF